MKIRLNVLRHALSTALLLAAGSGCATDPSEPTDDPNDTTAPEVVDTLPASNGMGVTASEKILVTFSEQMDPATVEAAYSSAELPRNKVSFEWSAGGTVLAISPDAPLSYAEGFGTDLTTVEPLRYAITIGPDATDLAGNALGVAHELSFSTRRRMVASFGLDLDLTRVTVTISSLANSEIMIGDTSSAGTYRSYLAFDLSTMPAGSEVESAKFSGRQMAPEGVPYSLGGINVHHVSYTGITGGALASAQVMSQPGMFSEDPILETKTIDVTSQMSDDVTHRTERGDRSQYRLQIDQATNSDAVADRAFFAKGTFSLTATYLVD